MKESYLLTYFFLLRSNDVRESDLQKQIRPLIGTLKTQSNGTLYSNTVIGTLAVDGWAVTVGTVRRGLDGLRVTL